jgi:folate-binding protein YgfZ
MTGEIDPERRLFRITGKDARDFLQGLVTNDVRKLDQGAVYAALLSPQGKYLADFFLVPDGDAILLDVKADLADALVKRLNMYRLRSAVTIEPLDRAVVRGTGPAPEGAFADPRHPGLGWRAYDGRAAGEPSVDWDALRVSLGVPETGVELLPDDSYILEMGFERLHGVDFRKGCYVGQEVTARMKHKTELRKGLARIRIEGDAAPGTEIEANGKPVGTLLTRAGDMGLAYLRFDRAEGDLRAGEASVALAEEQDA